MGPKLKSFGPIVKGVRRIHEYIDPLKHGYTFLQHPELLLIMLAPVCLDLLEYELLMKREDRFINSSFVGEENFKKQTFLALVMEVNSKSNFPYEIKEFEPDLPASLRKAFASEERGFIRVGLKGYVLPGSYKNEAAKLYNFEVRPSDVFVTTFPRSGTTWTQEMVWLLQNDLDFTKAQATPLTERFPFLEVSVSINQILQQKIMDEAPLEVSTAFTCPVKKLTAAPSPRFIKSHLPLSLLPPTLLETAKVVFVARDPRDVAISQYHFRRLISIIGFDGDFKNYWNLFIKDHVNRSPYFEVVKEAWEQRHHPNMMFLFYEDMITDLLSVVQRVSKFLGKQYSGEQLEQLCDHLKIDNLRKNRSVNMADVYAVAGLLKPGEQPFIRKGKPGGWRDYFDEEMCAQAQRWMEHNLRDTDLRYPEHTK